MSAQYWAAVVRELGAAFDQLNYAHFRDKLSRPVLSVHEDSGRLGYYVYSERRLSIAQKVVQEQPWLVVLEVLKHEMAHQFVYEELGIFDESAHGPTFTRVCSDLGIDAAASGLPRFVAEGPSASSERPEDAVLRRVAKLLALAESPNRNEAELAMRQAQRLMLKHNIDRTVETAKRGYAFSTVGAPTRRIGAHEQSLATLLRDHFFVDVIWVESFDAATGKRGDCWSFVAHARI